MRKAILFSTILFACTCTFTYYSIHKHTSSIFKTEVEDEDNPDNEFSKAVEEEQKLLRDPKTGKIPTGIRELELMQAKEIFNSWVSNNYNASKVEAANYTFQGPSNFGGRTRALAFDVSDASGNTMIAGSVSGGVFKTTNGGASWTRVNIGTAHYSITSVAQDTRPGFQNIWYYSTGEAIGNSAQENGDYYMGDGIYKSTDGGNSWSHLASSNSGSTFTFDNLADQISTVVVNPVTGDVYAACIGVIMRSQNQGASWSIVLNGVPNSTSNTTDVIVTSTGRMYAAMAGYTPTNYDGVWTSPTGDGSSWTHLAGTGAATNPAGWNPYNTYGRIVLALAPSNENLVYALYYNNQNSTCSAPVAEAEFYRWDQSASTWTDLSATLPNEPGCSAGNDPFAVQQGYDMAIAVKPDDANTIFIGGTNVYRSTDAGLTWKRIGGYANATSYAVYTNHHPDIHTLKFSPASTINLYTGDDGGLQVGDITAVTVSWTSLNNDYRTYQYYHVAIKQEAGMDDFIGGAQDNANTTAIGGSTTMTKLISGDGVSVGLGSGTVNYKQYLGVNSGTVVRRNVSQAPNSIEADLTPTNVASIFVTYFYLDPDNTENLYYAGVIPGSPNLYKLLRITNASTATNASWSTFAFNFNGYIRSMAATRGTYNAASRLYLGTDNGKVYRLNDPVNAVAATAVPVDITPPGSANGATAIGLAVNPQNPDELMAVYSNYNIVHAFITSNAGSATPTWTAIEGNLNFPSYRTCMIINNASGTEYYVGTSVGLFKTTVLNGASTVWAPEASSEIGDALVMSLDLRTSDNSFAIGTHGLGMWKGTTSITLPVKFENFSGNLEEKNVSLKWATSREVNNRGFDVERSYDGQQFSKIGFVQGKGPGYNLNNNSYSFYDNALAQNLNYYRLKQIDLSGNTVYSPVILIKSGTADSKGLKILGNPFTDYLDVQLPEIPKSFLNITLTNISGNVVYSEELKSSLNRVRVHLEKAHLVKGIYILQITEGNKQYMAKVVRK